MLIGVSETLTSPSVDPRRLGIHRPAVMRDVPYVPTDDAVVMAMLRFASVTANDTVYDLGCGDGRIVIAAARHCGAHGVGVDIDPLRIAESRESAHRLRVTDRVQFHCKSFFDTDLRPATVVMMYLLPSINVKLRPKLMRELAPGTRIISNYFEMGDWQPDIRADVHHRVLYQWVMPARVDGSWRCWVNHPDLRTSMILRLSRKYQVVTGSARIGRRDVPISNGRLFGDRMTFKLTDWEHNRPTAHFSCQIVGKTLRGSAQPGNIGGPTFAWGGIAIH